MKILKKLNSFCIALFSISIFIQGVFAEKKVDNIWQEIENNEIKNETIEEKENKKKK